MNCLFILSLLLLPATIRAAQMLVVLNEPASFSYREALEGLRAEWPEPIETSPASRPLPPGPHGVIIALGQRSALQAKAAAAPLVVALAPSFRADGARSDAVVIAMTPSPERLVRFLAAAGVKRLLAVRSTRADDDFARRAAAAGKANGVSIVDGLLDFPGDLPGLLRGDGSRANALWLAPDPVTVTPVNFAVAKEYARVRGIPFFAPSVGLATGDVRGDLAVSFRDCGREAARAAREILAGHRLAKVVYPGELSERKLQPAR
ncbi:MAG: hypothetical protein HY923_03690 [Elusimicrobia bacterium]|nr:hypothetical protein [Elusimicrobiota bacterium]